MKTANLFFSLVLFLASISTIAQQEPCLFDYQPKALTAKVEQRIQTAAKSYLYRSESKSHDTLRTIPVVVHVVHEGGAENISDSQIHSQILVLNQDFQKLQGSPGNGAGANALLQFKLAKIDPKGRCTNGIVRLKSPLTRHQSYQRGLLKDLSAWDNKKYLNIYVVKSINGSVAGYASFPGGPDSEDGIVVQNNYFGNIGSASASTGRTTTHEVGHWLGLYHTFQDGCGDDPCTSGDFVCDTPPQSLPNYECKDLNTCNNDSPDLNDQKENYMNYTPGSCQNMFTAGQVARIHGTLDSLRPNIWSAENLLATGCNPHYLPPNNCPVIADFTVLNPNVCIGNTIAFIDKSLNEVNSWQWFFEGGEPATSSEANPEVRYNTVGSYSVQLVVSDTSGNMDTIKFDDYVIVSEPGLGANLPFVEDMESGLYPPESLTLINNDGGVTWELDSAASVSGRYSMRINNLINTNYGSADELVLPALNLSVSQTVASPYVRFYFAYAKSDETYSDELLVLLSTDCGASFKQVMYKTQDALATAPTTTDYFVPDETQWKEAKVLLWRYREEENVILKIVNVTDGGNNLYIDDIFVGDNSNDPTGIDSESMSRDIKLFPNPSNGASTLTFQMDNPTEVRLRLFSATGKELYHQSFGLHQPGMFSHTIETHALTTGVYFIKVDMGDFTTIRKLVVAP